MAGETSPPTGLWQRGHASTKQTPRSLAVFWHVQEHVPGAASSCLFKWFYPTAHGTELQVTWQIGNTDIEFRVPCGTRTQPNYSVNAWPKIFKASYWHYCSNERNYAFNFPPHCASLKVTQY